MSGKGVLLFQNADVLRFDKPSTGLGSRNECRRYSDIDFFETEFELKFHHRVMEMVDIYVATSLPALAATIVIYTIFIVPRILQVPYNGIHLG